MKIFKCRVKSKFRAYDGIFVIVAASNKASAENIITKRLLENGEKKAFKVTATLMRHGNDDEEKILVVVDGTYKQIGVEA